MLDFRQTVSERVLEKQYVPFACVLCILSDGIRRKNRDVAEVFAPGFSWPAAIDAATDVYNGVGISLFLLSADININVVRVLERSHITWCLCLVYVRPLQCRPAVN